MSKDSIDELRRVVYRYYPRGIPYGKARYTETAEHRRLAAAQRRAAAEQQPWLALLQRLGEQFPAHSIENGWPAAMDACYSGAILLNGAPSRAPDPDDVLAGRSHTVGFMVSFLGPYYVVYASRYVDDLEATRAALRVRPDGMVDVYHEGALYVVPASIVKPEIRAQAEREDERWRDRLRRTPLRRQEITLEPSAEEQPYVEHIARAIEEAFGCERMPPEVGSVVVPDVSTNLRILGQARLYDCLFSDAW